MGSDEKLALVKLRTALDAVRVAEQACMAADFGNVHVLGPLERIRAELAEIIAVVSDGVAPSHAPSEHSLRLREAADFIESATPDDPHPLVEWLRAAAGVVPTVDVQAWQHEEDPARVISAAQKTQAERDGGASASSVRPYFVPLVRASDVVAPSQEPSDADFELHAEDGICVAGASGPRDEAWAEIQRYGAQYGQDGPVTIYEVRRVPVPCGVTVTGHQTFSQKTPPHA